MFIYYNNINTCTVRTYVYLLYYERVLNNNTFTVRIYASYKCAYNINMSIVRTYVYLLCYKCVLNKNMFIMRAHVYYKHVYIIKHAYCMRVQ